ncbi:TadE/TadG family type IV pilus assembly protein [Mesorhizobium sp. KR2-14]|uniref:TadE/TadG family type IV pilus assembly protein n=1 Tax=Mesorhizobium sp. KR2-14 TaxID=3156610 RepID=UPI0032B32671
MNVARHQSAFSALDFLLLTTLFMLFTVGMIACGTYFGASISVQQIASEAARSAIDGNNHASLMRTYGLTHPFIDPARLSIETREVPGEGSRIMVKVRYDTGALPVWKLLGSLNLPSVVITREAIVRTGGI